ncbi:MAG: PGF-pre-PGF domain-containing protein [Methanosarcinales archaeon]|nr:PGF-pre-PGF domain-containing protein [Methanosarcinales archaeon]
MKKCNRFLVLLLIILLCITSVSTGLPSISEPEDQVIELGAAGEIIWTITDENPNNYWVLTNTSQIVVPSPYESGEDIIVPIDTSITGIRDYVIFASDATMNVTSDLVEVTVRDTSAPVITNPPDQIIVKGTEENIIWAITEFEPGIYWIEKDGEEIVSPQSYEDELWIYAEIDTSTVGTLCYTIFATDLSGNEASDEVEISIHDPTIPIITTPFDQVIEIDSESYIQWTITEPDPGMYWVLKDDEEFVSSQSYYDGEEITVLIDSSIAGTWSYTIFATDESGNEASDEAEVVINEAPSPPILTTPPDQFIYQGDTGTIVWTITESDPNMYWVYKDGEEVVSPQSYYDGEEITVQIDSSIAGRQTYSIFASDTSGDEASDEVDVTVTITFSDDIAPVITHPPDVTIDQGDEGDSIVWTITELNPDMCRVYKNGEEFISPREYYDGEEITVSIDTSATGTQIYSLFATDTSGNEASDQVEVIISDTDDPVITHPPDVTIDQLGEGGSIVWIITEPNPDRYWVHKNGEEFISPEGYYDGDEITVLIDTSATGTQTYSLFATDTSGNEASDQVEVIISDVNGPVITTPTNVTIDQWDEGGSIVWTITEPNPDRYWVHKDGEEFISPGGYSDGDEITVSIDTSATGTQTYSLFASDTSGNEASGQVGVIISDADEPVITTPPDVTIDQGDEKSIVWTITESNPDRYWVLNNKEEVVSPQDYHDGMNITIRINTSLAGIQNYSLYASDKSGNEAIDQVKVIITDTVAPIIHSIPLKKIKIGTTGNITWIINETNPGKYWILNNSGEIKPPESYYNGCNINVTLEPTELGTLSYTLFANDTSGNTASNQMNITVQNTTPLTITYPRDRDSTTLFSIYINGTAEGIRSIPVVEITANEKTETAKLELGDDNFVSFSHKIPLSIGTNTITVTADYGNDEPDSLTLKIIRKKEYNNKQTGGGSGGGSTSEDLQNILLKEIQREFVAKDERVCYHFVSEGNIISMINFTGMRTSGIIPAKVEILNHTSSLVNYAPLDLVYKNLNIWVGNLGWASSQNIANATISFKIEKLWVTQNNIDKSSIGLNRYEDGEWNMLVTSLIGQDTQYFYFKSETPGFSNFVVTGKQEYIGDPGSEGIDNKPQDDINENPNDISDSINTTTEEDTGIPGFNVIANLFILLIVVQLLRKKEDK